jgi:KRAB domain-containing zinc finger protein
MPRLKVKVDAEIPVEVPAGTHKCQICGRLFVEKRRLERHVSVHDENRTRNFECTMCGAKFFEQCHLDSHVRTHTGER